MLNKIFFRACLAVACVYAVPSQAQPYPERPVRVVQGYAPGGNADMIARIVSAEMARELKQPLIVEAQTGAGGTIAANLVARSKADGYTLLLATGGHAVADALYKQLKYESVHSFQMISTVTYFPFLLVVPADSPYSSLNELLDAARAGTHRILFGSAGIGTTHHLAGELLNSSAKVKMMHVPYRGDAASVVGVLGKEVDMVIAPPTAVISHIQAGKLKVLATTGQERWPDLPDLPTVAEQGVPGYDVRSWAGFMAPAGTPADVIAVLNKSVKNALEVPEVQKKLQQMGGEAKGSSPGEMTAMVSREIGKWTVVATNAGIAKQ